MKKILIIRFSALGDVILTTPLITVLQKEFPQAKIFYAIKESFAGILPQGVECLTLNREESFANFRRKVAAAAPYDLIIDLHSSLRSRILCLGLKTKKIVRFRKPYLKRLLTILTKKNFLRTTPSVPQRYLNTLTNILPTVPRAESLRPILYYQNLPFEIANSLKGKKYFLIAPGSRWFTKKWPLEYFLSLTRQICQKKQDYLPVLLGGPDEADDCRYIQQGLDRQALLLAGDLNLPQVVTLIRQARFIVCNDSGLMHMAAATDTPIYALFTSTIPEFGFAPLSPYAKIITAPDIPCRPCNHKGLAECPKGDYICGRKLTPETVLATLAL